MTSMTGYGRAQVETEAFGLEVEVKSYNSRFLEIVHLLPPGFSAFEEEIDARVRKVCARGRVEVAAAVRPRKSDAAFSIDAEALGRLRAALDAAEAVLSRKIAITLSDLAGFEGLLARSEEEGPSRYQATLFQALGEALEQLASSKAREGEATKADIQRLLGGLEEGFQVVKRNESRIEAAIKAQLLGKVGEILRDGEYDEGRFLQEVALMLVKYSINEELQRLAAHLAEASRIVSGSGPCGKRLDFLCQEINRETNTIGSKNILVEVAGEVVRMKDCLENIREQARNVE